MKIMLMAILAFSGLVFLLFTVFTILFRGGRKTSSAHGKEYPYVSLLKPIKQWDDGLAANIESFYAQDYPAYEILFAVDNFDDPCVGLLEALRNKYPHVPTTIVATGRPPFENPKIHKLARLESLSKGSLLWATDSNVRVDPDTLRRLTDEYLTHDAKAVFSPIRGSFSRTFGSLMENSSLNLFTSGGIISAWFFGHFPILVGKSFLVERRALKTIGGFEAFRKYLAEDFLMGEAFVKSGFRVSTNYTWVTHVSQAASIRSFYQRMSRWAKLRYHLRRSYYPFEIVTHPIILALICSVLLGRFGMLVLAATASVKIALEYLNFLFVNSGDRRRLLHHLLFPAAVLVKDFVLFAVYLTPFFSRRVEWRGGQIAIDRKTLIRDPARVESFAYEGA